MPDLLTKMKPVFRDMLEIYHHRKAKVEEFVEKRGMLANLIWFRLKRDYDLAQAKHTEADRFRAEYFSPTAGVSSPKPMLYFTRSTSALSSGSEELHPSAKRIASTPKLQYLFTKAVKDRKIDEFLGGLNAELSSVTELRAGHPAGQFDGLLKAMRAATCFIIRFYNRAAVNLLVDVDAIDANSDVYLQFFDAVARFSCAYVVDRELAIFSDDDKEGHRIDDEYFLNTGASKLDAVARDLLLEYLYSKLCLFGQYYTQMRILEQQLQQPRPPLSEDLLRILRLRTDDLTFLANRKKIAIELKKLYMDLFTLMEFMISEIVTLERKRDSDRPDKWGLFKEFAALKLKGSPPPPPKYIQTNVATDRDQLEVAMARVRAALDLQRLRDPFPGDIEQSLASAEINDLRRPLTPVAGHAPKKDMRLYGKDATSQQGTEEESNSLTEGAILFAAATSPPRPASAYDLPIRHVSIEGFFTPQPTPAFACSASDTRKRQGPPYS